MKNIKKIDIHAHAVAFPQYVPNCFPGGHTSPYDWIFLSMIKNLHHIMPSPFRRRGTAPAVDEVLEFNQ